MNQGPSWVRFMKKTRGKKFRGTVHNCPFKANLILFPNPVLSSGFGEKITFFLTKLSGSQVFFV
jgi:hypothetical protein